MRQPQNKSYIFSCNPNCYCLWAPYYCLKTSNEILKSEFRMSGRRVSLLLILNAGSWHLVLRKMKNYFTIKSGYLNNLRSTLPLLSFLVCASELMVVIWSHLLLIHKSLSSQSESKPLPIIGAWLLDRSPKTSDHSCHFHDSAAIWHNSFTRWSAALWFLDQLLEYTISHPNSMLPDHRLTYWCREASCGSCSLFILYPVWISLFFGSDQFLALHDWAIVAYFGPANCARQYFINTSASPLTDNSILPSCLYQS